MINIGCWGAGKLAEKAISQIKDTDMYIKCFCDCDEKKCGEIFFGYPIISPQELKQMEDIELIVVTTGYWESVLLQYIMLRFPLERIRYWDCEKKRAMSIYEIYISSVYSLNGEDVFLAHKFAKKENGFYVDVGSFHPFRFSNTYWAYSRGWNGINIDPNWKNYLLFEKLTPLYNLCKQLH